MLESNWKPYLGWRWLPSTALFLCAQTLHCRHRASIRVEQWRERLWEIILHIVLLSRGECECWSHLLTHSRKYWRNIIKLWKWNCRPNYTHLTTKSNRHNWVCQSNRTQTKRIEVRQDFGLYFYGDCLFLCSSHDNPILSQWEARLSELRFDFGEQALKW